MIDIVRELHGLVPVVLDNENEVFDRVPVVGDQKTMERGVEAQFSVCNAYSKTRRLEGLFFQLADWHHENKFLSVSFGPKTLQMTVIVFLHAILKSFLSISKQVGADPGQMVSALIGRVNCMSFCS